MSFVVIIQTSILRKVIFATEIYGHILKGEMRCNACWKELESQAITTTCGHLFCKEDASKIVSKDAACPICDQVLSKSHMQPVDINPSDDWINMAMAGVAPQFLMKSTYRSVMFYIGQKELEMQYKMNKIVGQCRHKCEAMQEKFSEKLEQVHTAYQKMAKRCQMMEHEIESLSKDRQELQEKYAEKSRQKRKLDEMYDQLRSDYESVKRSAIQPASNSFPRSEPDIFSNVPNMMDGGDNNLRQGRPLFVPDTPGKREDIWPVSRQNEPFDISTGSPTPKAQHQSADSDIRRPTRPLYGTAASNPSAVLRNLIISPLKKSWLSRTQSNMFS